MRACEQQHVWVYAAMTYGDGRYVSEETIGVGEALMNDRRPSPTAALYHASFPCREHTSRVARPTNGCVPRCPRSQINPGRDIAASLLSVATGETTMKEAVGPAVGCLMATFGTNMIASCIFEFEDPEDLK